MVRVFGLKKLLYYNIKYIYIYNVLLTVIVLVFQPRLTVNRVRVALSLLYSSVLRPQLTYGFESQPSADFYRKTAATSQKGKGREIKFVHLF